MYTIMHVRVVGDGTAELSSDTLLVRLPVDAALQSAMNGAATGRFLAKITQTTHDAIDIELMLDHHAQGQKTAS